MNMYTRKDLRGGITLTTENRLFRVGYIHAAKNVEIEVGALAFVGVWIYVVTDRHYVTYQDGSMVTSIQLFRFRFLEAIVATFIMVIAFI